MSSVERTRFFGVTSLLLALSSVVGCSAPGQAQEAFPLGSPLGSGLDQNRRMMDLTAEETQNLCRSAVREQDEQVALAQYCRISGADYAMLQHMFDPAVDLAAACQDKETSCLAYPTPWLKRAESCAYYETLPLTSTVGSVEQCSADVITKEARSTIVLLSCADLPAYVAAHTTLQEAAEDFDGYPSSCANTYSML